MLNYIKSLFGIKPKETAVEVTAPYKIETVAVAPVTEQAVQAVVESIAPAKKKPAAKQATTAKKPRAPKASK